MTLDYIPINSIDDIDPLKISIRDINKRYVDREGNRYATRFNLQTRRVEVVRLAKTRDEALRVRDQILQEKRKERRERTPADRGTAAPSDGGGVPETGYANLSSAAPGGAADFAGQDYDDLDDLELSDASDSAAADPSAPAGHASQQPFHEAQLIHEALEDLPRQKERMLVIVGNLKKAEVFGRSHGMADIERELDVDCWQRADSAVNYAKELQGYPRTLTHYLGRLSDDERRRVESAPDDERRLELIKRFEIRRNLEDVYRNFQRRARQLYDMVNQVSEDQRRTLPAQQREQLEDAEASSQILLEAVGDKLEQIQLWKRRIP